MLAGQQVDDLEKLINLGDASQMAASRRETIDELNLG